MAIPRLATNRLSFFDADKKMFLGDVCFLLTLILAILVLWRLKRLVAQALSGAQEAERRKQAESLITLSVRVVWPVVRSLPKTKGEVQE